ncbi:histidine kinase dimerization/phospho-acceptor domain-containing protein [Nocardioides marmorisolisilvae]|uniref:histidine kinase n=1 Tax=Nocardioides marmorisolisilvae TaxID=1542737 RepID=A0A3N0DSA3_9ACTN|nr:histidine kinase dimerization/phospho-acceptor domain-containing protein [Nocardioides marmorisolisilvae]RNL78508.1 sensor histidine kinase [Nocardioides marmorisolisilvae]
MRERLVAAFVGLTVLVVALYGIPRAYFLADLVRTQEQHRVDRTVELARVAIDERVAAHQKVTPAFLDRLADEDERIRIDTGGTLIDSTDGPRSAKGNVTASAKLANGDTVWVLRSADAVDAEIARALLPLVVLGLVLAVLAGAAGFVIARRMSRPFQQLAEAARGLGAGRLHPNLPAYRVPEAQAIGEALRSSGEKLDALLTHERELAVHASHELRTPVTALKLELEDLALWPETPETVSAQLGKATAELDRLSEAIAELLASSREVLSSEEIDLDLDALLADTVERLNNAGIAVIHDPSGPMPTRLDPQPLIRVLAMVITSGQGAAFVSATDRSTHLEVRVGWSGTPPKSASAATNELAASIGGNLSLDGQAITLRLPKRAVSSRKDDDVDR